MKKNKKKLIRTLDFLLICIILSNMIIKYQDGGGVFIRRNSVWFYDLLSGNVVFFMDSFFCFMIKEYNVIL